MKPEPYDDAVTLTIDLTREALRLTGGAFPEHLLGDISKRLSRDATRGDMDCQLMRLFVSGPVPDIAAMRMDSGSLLYVALGGKAVVWGAETFRLDPDFRVSLEIPIQIIHDRPCWVDRHDATGERRVNWAGEKGSLCPPDSISHLCAGLRGPCYAVNVRDGDGTVGYVVEGRTRHRPFASVENLAIDIGKPSYVGRNTDGSVTTVIPS